MSDAVKQVKVDNWGIYFLQRLKHFFNRTDYCDLTLQFQDNAQLKVHRLVLSACTEYFELLERTCEMYEDCLVMPDDLQADVVVPIVNFMYTGHLEFRMDLLERLYQTSQILNMPVLSKLLESHRNLAPKAAPIHSYSGIKRTPKNTESKTIKSSTPVSTASTSQKRSYSKAFDNVAYKEKKNLHPVIDKNDSLITINNTSYCAPPPPPLDLVPQKSTTLDDSRPTRYELPEELDTDNVFDNSFCNISYTSQPLMVHPETVRRYSAKKSSVFSEPSSSKKLSGISTVDIVECKRITREENIFEDSVADQNPCDETEMFVSPFTESVNKDSSQLFDQILDQNDGPKVTIETKDSKIASNLDHARIISEVLKKYPHLVKSNKSIKLKILDPTPSKTKKQQKLTASCEEKPVKLKAEKEPEYIYETDVIDSKRAAKLIAMGAENTKGPWICLICGTPGKALHFPSYYTFRRHLVEVHNDKPSSNICEYCGLRSFKRHYLLHHLYAQHGVPPPPQYNFPKCNLCSYIALTESLLIKHKMTHKDSRNFRCNVCVSTFASSSQLLTHIQNTGHKYRADTKNNNLQCIYCLRVFLRETNLYAHIKTHHKKEAKNDGIIEDSDEEIPREEKVKSKNTSIKFEPSTSYDYEDVDLSYQVQTKGIEEIPIVTRKQVSYSKSKQKILNPGFDTPKPGLKTKGKNTLVRNQRNAYAQDVKIQMPSMSKDEEIVIIDNEEYIMKNNKLIPRKRKSNTSDFILAETMESTSLHTNQQPTTSVQYSKVQNTNIDEDTHQQTHMIINKAANLNQQIQIVVSNEEEYKALMASNHPILFEDGDTNKTLTVLTTQHNPTIETLDLANSRSNEMMIIPDEFPLNEGVSPENPNIVVVYSHPVDDQNKQYQILTTGGIGAQFVQSSAILTQNYETVTTSAPVMNAHCMDVQVEQSWQNNIPTIEDQHMHIMPNDLESEQVEIKPVHIKPVNNYDELPEVHLVPTSQSVPPPAISHTNIISNHLDSQIEQLNQPIQQVIEASETSCEGQVNPIISSEILIQNTNTLTNNTNTHAPQHQSMPDSISNTGSINVIEEPIQKENINQQIETDNLATQQLQEVVLEQHNPPEGVIDNQIPSEDIEQIVPEDIIEQQPIREGVMEQQMQQANLILDQMETEVTMGQELEPESTLEPQIKTGNIIEQSRETEYDNEQQTESDNVTEQPRESEYDNEQHINSEIEQPRDTEYTNDQQMVSDNIIEQPRDTVYDNEQPMEIETMEQAKEEIVEQSIETENASEQLIETENDFLEQTHSLQKEVVTEDGCVNTFTVTDNMEVSENKHIETSSHAEKETIASQAYDDIEEINHDNTTGAGEKIQNLTSEWSEDEYDVPEEGTNAEVEKVSNEIPENPALVPEVPEIEESIENIQEEVKKQMATPIETDGDTEESAISSHEEDTSSQEMQLPPLNESPLPTIIPNPQAQQKISSLLNDWDDNDTQESIEGTLGTATQDTPECKENTSEAKEDTLEDKDDTLEDKDDTLEGKEDTSEGTGEDLATSKKIDEIAKNDNIKSLVSDWDDDEEECKD